MSKEEWYGTMRLQTSMSTSIYNYLVNEEGLFSNKYDLFCFGLVYGLLHNKTDKSKKAGLIPITSTPKNVQAVLDICYLALDDGRKTTEIFKEMCEYADGGVLALNEIYKENKSFTIPDLIKDAEELWNKRVKDLENINLS